MKKIAIITSTRAEYGLLSKLISNLRQYENNLFHVDLIVTGTHLYKEYGNTIEEILNDKNRVDKRVFIPVSSENIQDISNNQAEILVTFTKVFIEEMYSGIVILGDRYEMLSIAIAAGNTRTPIFHLCGGDTTEGAMDEWIRHSITKMSYMHFVSNEKSKKRVIQLGENPKCVYNYGSTSIDNIISLPSMTKSEALNSVNLENCRYAICTYHPVTLDDTELAENIYSFLFAIKMFPEIQFIITKPNADQGSTQIGHILDNENKNFANLHIFTSLGYVKFLSLMKYAEFVIGNSSSGIIETPSFQVPTINIGNRQKGRLQCDSIINCREDENSIVNAINLAISEKMKKKCKTIQSPYGEGNAAKKIAKKINETILNNKIDLKKSFFEV